MVRVGNQRRGTPSWEMGVVVLFAVLVCLSACARQGHSGTRAFYYWRTTFQLSAQEAELLRELHVSKLYLRLLDIAWDPEAGAAVPVAQCTFVQPLPDGVEIVPVVYIKSEVFTKEREPRVLADHVWQLVMHSVAAAQSTFREVQVDCDWTDSTRGAYFEFCSHMSELASASDRQVSATIRLHQIKYKGRTGVPPVRRGMLMFYNVGRLADALERSPIFNMEDASRYVATIDAYPLPLDAALAIFAWGVHMRDGQVIGLISKPDMATIANAPGLKQVAKDTFRAQTPGFLGGKYLQEGDVIRIDAIKPAAAREAASLLAHHFHPRGGFTIALFDLDERNMADYVREDLDGLYSALR